MIRLWGRQMSKRGSDGDQRGVEVDGVGEVERREVISLRGHKHSESTTSKEREKLRSH